MKMQDSRTSFEMVIVGPQEYGPVPAELRDAVAPDDDVWLVIGVHLRSDKGEMQCQGPWIQAKEVIVLATWLSELSRGEAGRRQVWFEEPNLIFEAVAPIENGHRVRVVVDAECRVQWSPGDVGDPGSFVEIDADARALDSAASDLFSAIRTYRRLN